MLLDLCRHNDVPLAYQCIHNGYTYPVGAEEGMRVICPVWNALLLLIVKRVTRPPRHLGQKAPARAGGQWQGLGRLTAVVGRRGLHTGRQNVTPNTTAGVTLCLLASRLSGVRAARVTYRRDSISKAKPQKDARTQKFQIFCCEQRAPLHTTTDSPALFRARLSALHQQSASATAEGRTEMTQG